MYFPGKIPCTLEGHSNKICWLHNLAEENYRSEIQDDVLVCRECSTFKEVINRGFGRRTADQTLGKTIAKLLILVSDKTARLQKTSEELRSRIEELALIKIITDAVIKTTDLHKALKIILTGVTSGRAFGFNRAGILMVDNRQEYLVGRHAVGPKDKIEAAQIWNELRTLSFEKQLENILEAPVTETDRLHRLIEKIKISLSDSSNIFIQVLRGGKPKFFRRDQIDPEMAAKIRIYFDFNEFIIIPLRADGPPLGLMVADNYFTGQPIVESSIDALQTLAAACTNVLEKTLLHQQLSDRLRELEHVNKLLRENQNYLIQTERLADIGKLAATVAHEFRTPLVTIGGFARRILRTLDSGKYEKKDLEIIAAEVDRLETITAELLEYSRQKKLNLKPHNINTLIKNSLELMNDQLSSGGIVVETKYDQKNPSAALDERRFRQVMLNIIGNAIDAMKPGDKLIVGTNTLEAYVRLEIKDTGCGILHEDKSEIFTPFFTTKSRGSGLGLPISKKIVEDHGGYIEFESDPGMGTRFSIYFPRNVTDQAAV